MPMVPQPPGSRQQYESLLNELLDTAHNLIREAGETDPELASTIDDSKIHVLVQYLRDEFGPEVPR